MKYTIAVAAIATFLPQYRQGLREKPFRATFVAKMSPPRPKHVRGGLLALTRRVPRNAVEKSMFRHISRFSTRPLPRRTWGGFWFWSDLASAGEYRLQQHARSAACRVLDGGDRLVFSGSYSECTAALDRLGTLADPRPTVVLLHGLAGSRGVMAPLERHLRNTGYNTFNFAYPSTLIPIERAAQALRSVLDSLPPCVPIHLVGHSLGGIVIRAALAEPVRVRLGRVVFLGTPHQGSELAARLAGNVLFRSYFGPAGQQLVAAASCYSRNLAAPPVPFGIIAGGRGNRFGFNPFLPGDNDGTVTVASTQLDGAADFLLIRRIHRFMPCAAETLAAVEHFLAAGCFRKSTATGSADCSL